MKEIVPVRGGGLPALGVPEILVRAGVQDLRAADPAATGGAAEAGPALALGDEGARPLA